MVSGQQMLLACFVMLAESVCPKPCTLYTATVYALDHCSILTNVKIKQRKSVNLLQDMYVDQKT